MADRENQEILIIEHDEKLRIRIETILTQEGYTVQTRTISLEGLSLLEEKENNPFSLVISSFRMPKMAGDQILEQAKLISPLTQRMIITEPAEIETVIGAVNKAEVHACLSIPFTDEDFVFQVNQCLQAHVMEMKRVDLVRVTERQNRQMYKLAKTFKTREDYFASQIKAKTKQLRVEESRRKLRCPKGACHVPTLADVLEAKAAPFSSTTFARVWKRLSNDLLTLVNTACAGADIKLKTLVYEAVRNAAPISETKKPLDEVLSMLYTQAMETSSGKLNPEGDEGPAHHFLDNYVEIIVSDDRLKVFARLKKKDADIVTVEAIRERLEALGIKFGIKEDSLIKTWISVATSEGKPFVIAQGEAPVLSVDARVDYHFQTDFLHAGKVRPDGSIDFRERGNIPFVTKGLLLAEKTNPRQGKSGIDISGAEIPVVNPVDVIFNPGPGARMSGDGLKIYADCDGQPHLDAMGNVSVLSELTIQGDVDFETGNIDFKGNIIVGGVVKEGFSVRGANLTVGQIEGADIELTGDLNVGGGIIDAKLIRVQGSIQARYINNSFIRAFGDLIVQKEIIDSRILLSGGCDNPSGNIISSTIAAKGGVNALSIGTETSAPSRIRVGVDDHLQAFFTELNEKTDENLAQVEAFKKQIINLDEENQTLHLKISDAAHTQDRSQVELRKIEEQMAKVKASNDFKEIDRLSKMVKKLHHAAQMAEDTIDKAFHRQDILSRQTQEIKEQISLVEDKNRLLAQEKEALVAFSKNTEALAQVTIAKKAMPETTIEGPNSVMRIKNVISRSRIVEVKREGDNDGGVSFFEMVVSSLN